METITGELTADDVAALRMADSVVFRHRDGVGEIAAQLNGGYSDVPRIFTVKEQRLFPDADRRERERKITVESHVSGYHKDAIGCWSGNDATVAFAMINSAQYDAHWPTIASLLKTGDTVRLGWVASNNNGYLNEAGLHFDRLDLKIQRGDRKLVFLVDTSVTADNSARMVKRNG